MHALHHTANKDFDMFFSWRGRAFYTTTSTMEYTQSQNVTIYMVAQWSHQQKSRKYDDPTPTFSWWIIYDRIQRRYSRFLYNLLTAPQTVSNTYAQVARAQSCANHVQHIEHCLSRASVMLRATWYEGTAQL